MAGGIEHMDRAPRPNRTALVVDDDVFVLSALAEMMSEDGYDVHTASNGFSAIRLATELRPLVILLDLVLPERSGAEVLMELRSEPLTRDSAVVIVSGYADSLSEAELAEADGVVGKPFDVSELLMTVQRAVQRAAGRRDEVAPVAAVAHREQAVRQQRRAANPRRTRGRR
jgi:two-component system, OmpR family, KDP operon response regulator KdpE